VVEDLDVHRGYPAELLERVGWANCVCRPRARSGQSGEGVEILLVGPVVAVLEESPDLAG